MGDLFHKEVDANWIDEILGVVRYRTRHTYIFLTKRPQRMGLWEFPRNCWLGVTAESQKQADERIPILLEIPAAIRFVSVEPMLEGIDMREWLGSVRQRTLIYLGLLADIGERRTFKHDLLDWVICGAETGPGARYMKAGWARDLRDQCKSAGVPFFFKKASKGDEIDLPREFPND
jgi:protein gp37